jgi:hypothetical protein
MAVGPGIMALGLLWYSRIPATSSAWVLGTGSVLPPSSYFVDLLPGILLFGFGLSIMVAPLTTALMTSVPAKNSGVASAINNAISRVGSPLLNAVIFVVVASSFYGAIASRVPSAPVDSQQFRNDVAPLNKPTGGVSPEVAAAVKDASTDAFHLAMLVAAGMLLTGAAVNGFGIRNPSAAARHLGPGAEQPPSGAGSGAPTGPVKVAPEDFAKRTAPPPERTGPARDT